MSLAGQIAYHFVHQPAVFLRKLGKHDGFPQCAFDYFHSISMRRHAFELAPCPGAAKPPPLAVAYLTGAGFSHMTAFAHASLAHHLPSVTRPLFLSDGSLNQKNSSRLRSLFPDCRVLMEEEAAEQIDRLLPRSRFPTLRRLRSESPLMRKLLDVHLTSPGWKLFQDSDTLFCRKPSVLEYLSANPTHSYLLDNTNSYGIPDSELNQVSDQPILRRVNSGLVLMNSDTLDFDRLEHWAARLYTDKKADWFTEQCLTALWLTTMKADRFPHPDYQICPTPNETLHPSGVFHHYCGPSRNLLYRHGWRRFLKENQG